MGVTRGQAPAARRHHPAIAAGALVAGAFEAMHCLTWTNRINGWCVAFTALGVFAELEVLTKAFELGLGRRRSSLASFALSAGVAVGTGILVSFAGWGIQAGFHVPVLGLVHSRMSTVAQLGAFNGLVGVGLWAIAVLIPLAVRDAKARDLEAEQLRTAAELARLRANVQPHFLLNTLSTVAGLLTEDPRAARNLIGALGELLRDSLEDADEMQTLEDEVRWLRRYAEILEERHRGSIAFRWDIADATRAVRVPRLLLQPLLENAVKHGALRRCEGGEVAVRTTVGTDGEKRITCVVEDNGPGPVSGGTRPGALGIELVRRRLALKYAGAAVFRLESSDGRTRSIVEIPAEAAS